MFKKIRIIKTKQVIMAFVLLSIGNGCNEKNINLDPLSVTEAAYFKEEIDFDRSVLAVYAKLTDFYYFNGNNPIHGFWQLPGDDITTSGADAFEIFGTIQPATDFVGTYYRVAYQLINRANTTLQKIEEEKGVYKTANLKNHHKGEALFLRGLMNFNLSNYFATSPLITKRIQGTSEITQPSSADGALLEQAIKDFTEAATLLPTKWDDSNKGRATTNAANGFLGKALIFRASIKKQDPDYNLALVALNKVTEASLTKDFESNFDVKDENNSESIFEFQASQPGGGDNVWLSNDFDNSIGSTSAYWGYYENHWSLFGKPPYIATKKLLNAFDKEDPRLKVTMDVNSRAIKKYVNRDQKSQSGAASINNARMLRYADILLLKAEAILLSGGSTAESLNLINQVRTRARIMKVGGTIPANYLTSEVDKNKIFNWIVSERFIELAGEEGIRWLDLRRWHLAGKINLSTFDFSSERSDLKIEIPKNLNYPIPLNEIDLNPNVKQNVGY